MNILLAFKAEPDLALLAETDWQAATSGTAGPDPALMRVVMGNDEQGAAELMLHAKAANPTLSLSAVTLGDERALPALRHLAALGFEQRTLLRTQADLRFTPLNIAEQIAQQAKRIDAGLILLGSQSSEGQNGQTGWLLSEILGWPCLSQVCDLQAGGEGFRVQCENIRQRSEWQVQKPAVLIVQNRGQLALRVPGMRARLAAAKAEIEHLPCSLAKDSPLSCQSLTRQTYPRAGTILREASPQAAAQRLWQDYLAERMKS
ncbi:electron transfer flavoprotein subunit beta/FixA family protein [Enterobacteriaceae bacterium RIT691]|nr:electron transfer flavoprotein subunit beta/FixA family protein [Enterobacteriaceae bacterium RIT691]